MHFKGGDGNELFQPSLTFKVPHGDETEPEHIIELTKESKTKHHVDMFKNTTAKWTHVRRGQDFEIEHDKIAAFFGERKWIMRLQTKDQKKTMDLKINSKFIVEPIPISAAVGIYDVSFVDPANKAYPAGQIVVLFNPYLKNTDVYGSPTLAEYIEQEVINIHCIPLHIQKHVESFRVDSPASIFCLV